MGSSWITAVPVGLVLFVGTLVGALRRKAGKELARAEYPSTAEGLGLVFQKGEGSTDLGRFKGDYGGKGVLVVPSEGRIVLELSAPVGVILRNYAHYKRTPAGLEPFSIGVRWADAWFQNRYCSSGLGGRLHLDAGLIRLLERLRPYQGAMKQFALEGRRLECVLHYGSPQYVPAAAIRELLPILAELADCCSQDLAPLGAEEHSP